MNVVYTIPHEQYLSGLKKVIKQAHNASRKRICYISVNFPYQVIRRLFSEMNVSHQNFHVFDLVSKKVGHSPPNDQHSTYINPGKELDELRQVLSTLPSHTYEVVLIDSLSSFLLYHHEKELVTVLQRLLTLIPNHVKRVYHTMLTKDQHILDNPRVQMLVQHVKSIDDLKDDQPGGVQVY